MAFDESKFINPNGTQRSIQPQRTNQGNNYAKPRYNNNTNGNKYGNTYGQGNKSTPSHGNVYAVGTNERGTLYTVTATDDGKAFLQANVDALASPSVKLKVRVQLFTDEFVNGLRQEYPNSKTIGKATFVIDADNQGGYRG